MEANDHVKVENPVLHVLVIGFHHKKGCQVEYSYPPLIPGSDSESNECPPGWKYLPTLALPDGSHNYDQDTVYFHLPSLTDPDKTVFGISCFRQIPVEKLKNRTADITRGTVQKSVCVLSLVPLYGHIQVKMSLITHAYFDEGDFTKVSLLKDTYHHLNACLNQIDDLQNASQLFVGLSGRELVLHWRHKTVLLFKLLLLERKVVFYRSPVQPLCATILSLLSLHPGMMETGLYQSACIQPSRPMSPVPQFLDTNKKTVDDSTEPTAPTDTINQSDPVADDLDIYSKDVSLIKTDIEIVDDTNVAKLNDDNRNKTIRADERCVEKCDPNKDGGESIIDNNKSDSIIISDIEKDDFKENRSQNSDISNGVIDNAKTDMLVDDNKDSADEIMDTEESDNKILTEINGSRDVDNPSDKVVKDTCDIDEVARDVLRFYENEIRYIKVDRDRRSDDMEGDDSIITGLPRDISVETLGETTAQNNMVLVAQINAKQCGVPLPLFTQGYLCMPYLSLPYMDLLTDKNVRGYLVGATNVLFKQKKRLADVLIEVESARIETGDLELRRLLHLTTEDLRFADFLVRHVAEERHDVFLDGVGWEGGDEWIRAQFRVYLLCLLRTSLLQEGSRELDHFNSAFMAAWRQTASYKSWFEDTAARDGILEINPGHPFAGQLSVADMKLRLAHTMQNTEGGRKLNQAVLTTGRAVATTGRAVGGAISHAKGALSNWWSNLTTAQSPTDIGNPEMTTSTQTPPAVDDQCEPVSQLDQRSSTPNQNSIVPTASKGSIIEV